MRASHARLLPTKSAQFFASLRPRQQLVFWPLRLGSLLFFSLLCGVEAWVREAPVQSIQFRIPPEESYYEAESQACTNQQCVNSGGTSCINQTCLNQLVRTSHVVPGYKDSVRPPPQYYAADGRADIPNKPRSQNLQDWKGGFSPWLFYGCFRLTRDLSTVGGFIRPTDVNPDSPPALGDVFWNPLNCTTACSSRNFSVAAMANGVMDCFCASEMLNTLDGALRMTNLNFCSAPCELSYFNGTTRYCGALQQLSDSQFYYSFYRVYDNIQGNSQGTLDPFRNIWYIAVTIEIGPIPWDTDYGNTTKSFEWWLHASSTVNGDPMFPFHRALDGPHYGLQYDLDNSSIIGYTVPHWPTKGRPPAPMPPPSDGSPAPSPTNYWFPVLYRYEMDSGDPNNIYWLAKDTVGTLPTEEAIFVNGVTCLDSVYGIYYVVQPSVRFPYNEFSDYDSKILGFDLGDGAKEVLGQRMIHNVVALAVDNRDHTLYGLMLDAGNLTFKSCFLFFRLGEGNMQIIFPSNPFDPIMTVVTFDWTFAGKTKPQVIFNHDLYWNTQENLTTKQYHIGSLALDSEENVTFVVYKDYAHLNQKWWIKDVALNKSVSQDTTPRAQIVGPMTDTWGVSALMIANPDPIIPWFRPRVEYLRFDIDGMMIELKMQNFTKGGVQPYDVNGDILPDKVDWEINQFGDQNCSEMFGPNVSQYLGILPNSTMSGMCGAVNGDVAKCHPSLIPPYIHSTCEWYYNDTIRIHFCCDPETLLVGDPVDLKNYTIFGYYAGLNTWTFAAYGIYGVQMPTPLVPPVVEIFSVLGGISNVDLTFDPYDEINLCKTGGADARNSYNHGGTPQFTWSVEGYRCKAVNSFGAEEVFGPNITLFDRLKAELVAKSVGSSTTYKERGYKAIHFPDHGLMEPGCEYSFRLHVKGRWGLSVEKRFVLHKLAPPPVTGWIPSCDYHCNLATCEMPSVCKMLPPGPRTGPMVEGEKVCECDENRYGLFCREVCPPCTPYRTHGCDDGRMGSGNCICKVGYDGSRCDEDLEFMQTEWSECSPCGVAVGSQFRQFACTNIQTFATVNASRCKGTPPVTLRQCAPALCPCTSPPEIVGADNNATAIKCANTKSGESCSPVCLTGYIPVGVFRCYSANYVEQGVCQAAGQTLTTVPGVHMAFKVKLRNWQGTKEDYLAIVHDPIVATVQSAMLPVRVSVENIKVRIRHTAPFELSTDGTFDSSPELTQLSGGRRLQDVSKGDRKLTVKGNAPNSSTYVYWRRWLYERLTRAIPKKVKGSPVSEPRFNLSFANFNGHRAFGIATTPPNTNSERASSSIASRLSALSGDMMSGSGGMPVRRLQSDVTETHYELLVTIAFPSSVEQTAAHAGLMKVYETPSIFENTFEQKMLEHHPHCGNAATNQTGNCPLPPHAWDFSMPQLTQLYADSGLPVNFTGENTTTTATPFPEEESSNTELITGISLGVSIGICAICIPLIILGVCRYQKKHSKDKVSVLNAPEILPPGPQRNWEMPESAKICDADGAALTGHIRREWQGGGTYEGQVQEGTRQGNGRMEWPNGKCYAGQWLFGRPHGHGLLHAPGERGWTYNGQFKDGQRDGVGRCESFARKMWYDGAWSGGLQNGMGENGNLPTLPSDLFARVLPPPVAHVWWMEQGEQTEHVSISKVAPESRDLIGLALDATPEDWERLAGSDYLPGGMYGPPASTLQAYSRLWGICFGEPDSWLPSSWGALIITRIMEDGALARWNMWQVRDFGSNANEIHPNALIWRVNGVEGDVEKMAEELCGEEGRHRIQLAVSNPPNIRFPKQTGLPWNKPHGDRTMVQSIVPASSLFLRPPGPQVEPRPPPKSPQRLRMVSPSGIRGVTPPSPKGLRAAGVSSANATGLPQLAELKLPGAPPSSHQPPPRPHPGQPLQPGLPALPKLPRSSTRDLTSLPALPKVQLPQHPNNAVPSAPLSMPPVQLQGHVQQNLSTVSLPPPPLMSVAKPPPGRPITPGLQPGRAMPGMVTEPGPPPKKAAAPRVGYRQVANARQIAHLGGQSLHPNPPG